MSNEIKNALRLARAFGGMAYEANNVANGMSGGGAAYQLGGVPATNMSAQPNPAAPAANPALTNMGQPPMPPNMNGAMSPSPPPFIPAPNQMGGMNALNTPMNHLPTSEVGYAKGGAVEAALEKTHGPHAIPLHQAIARSGYEEGGEVPFTEEEIHDLLHYPLGREQGGPVLDESSQQEFLHKELEGSAPQYDPEGGIETAKEWGRNIATMNPAGAAADAAGYLGGPSIRENFNQGNYGTAAMQAVGAVPFIGPLAKMGAGAHMAMSMMPKARAVEDALRVAEETPKAIRAYHYSPESFDRFDMSKIGTGHGKDAYGTGLYFGENENAADTFRAIINQDKNLPRSAGHMYEAELKLDPNKMIDYNRQLHEQPEYVREALINKLGHDPVLFNAPPGGMVGQRGDFVVPRNKEQMSLYNEAGLHGTRYYDPNTSTKGYVAFSDEPVSIVRKYEHGGAVEPLTDEEIHDLLHYPLGRHGYATDGSVEADVQFAPDANQFENSHSIMAGEAPPEREYALPMRPYGQRFNEKTQDFNTPEYKDIGFYGPVSVGEGDHVASEYSRGSDGMQYPSVAADMPEDLKTQAFNAARFDAPVPEEADKFARDKASERISQGRSPFYEPGKDPFPKWSPEQHWEKPYGIDNALKLSNKVLESKPYGEFGLLPLRTDNGKVVYDPNAMSMTEFVKHAFTPKISPAEIAQGAYEMLKGIPKSIQRGAKTARRAWPVALGGEGTFDPNNPEDFAGAQDIAGLAMTGSFGGTRPAGALASGMSREAEPVMTKKQSQAAAKANWETNPDPNFNSWQHKWNVEEGQKYRVAPPQNVEPLPVVQQKPIGFQLPEPYNRVTNPAGFYSHAAEASRALPQQKGTLEQMLAALKGYGVRPEEIRWSGVEQAFADRPSVTGEELAEHFEKRLPQVDRITKSELGHEIYGEELNDIVSEEFNQIYGEEFADDLARELEDHDLENMSESARERLEERLGDRITEDYWERAYERAHDTARERAEKDAPKWGGKDYNFPGGEDYFENILTLPHRDMSGIHPEVMDYATKTELKELEKAKDAASRNFDNVLKNTRLRIRNFYEDNLMGLAQRKINELKSFGHKFTTQDEVKAAANREKEAFDTYLQADKAFKNSMGTGPIEEFETGQIMNKAEAAHKKAEEEYKKVRDNNEENYYYNLLTELRGKYKPETLAEELGKTEEFKSLEYPPEQDAALEEMQQTRKEYDTLNNQLLEASKQHWSQNPEYEGEFFQHKTHLGDITNPVLHGRFQTHNVRNPETGEMMKVLNESESQSDWSKENFVRQLNPQEQQELSKLSQMFEVERTPEENLRLSELLTSVKSPGKTKEVPYVGKLKHWSDLAAKDALSHAIENGFDRIFITGGQEQAARWSSGIRSAAENIDWNTKSELGSVDLPAQVLEPYSHALFSKQYYELTEAERDSLRRKVDLIQRGQEENIFPKNIYAIPKEGKVVNVQMANGQDVRMNVKSIVQPNGQKKNIVVQADRSGIEGQPLSAVVGSDLEKQIMSAKDGRKDLSNYMMGASGYETIYDKEKPDSYRRVMKSLDPKAKVEPGVMPVSSDRYASVEKVREAFSRMNPDQKAAFGNQVEELLRLMEENPDHHTYYRYMGGSPYNFRNYMKQFETEDRKGTWVHITPKMREEYQNLKRKYGAVFPAYKKGGTVYPKNQDALKLAYKVTGTR